MFVKEPASLEDLFRCMLIDYAHARGKSRCGEKSPWHLRAVPELMALYPRAKLLCTIRDGRDVVRSCRSTPIFTWEPDWWHCRTWCQVAALAARYQRHVPNRFLICRFEALVEDPEAEVKRIDAFLGLDFEPNQLNTFGVNGVVSRGEWWMQKAGKPPDPERAYAWRQSCPPGEAQYLTALMNPYLTRYGYDSYWSPSVAGPRAAITDTEPWPPCCESRRSLQG